eukprot:3188553-Rhodomonas_salina.1
MKNATVRADQVFWAFLAPVPRVHGTRVLGVRLSTRETPYPDSRVPGVPRYLPVPGLFQYPGTRVPVPGYPGITHMLTRSRVPVGTAKSNQDPAQAWRGRSVQTATLRVFFPTKRAYY